MTNYQLVPYLVSVSLRGKPDETTALDDLFAGGLRLEDELAGALAAGLGQILVNDGAPPMRLRVDQVATAQRLLVTEVAPGKSGIESTIRKKNGASTKREYADVELVPVRHLMLYPGGGHRAVLFAERVAGNGAITVLAEYLRDMWASKHNQMLLNIRPAMSNAAMKAAIDARPITRIKLIKPRLLNGNLMVGGQSVEYDLQIRPPRNKVWKLKNLGATPEAILSEVSPVLRPDAAKSQGAREAAAKQLLEEGWQVGVTLSLPGGNSRTVLVDDSSAISMSFPMVEDDSILRARPSNDDFVAACKAVVTDGFLGEWGLAEHAGKDCQWPAIPCKNQSGWKVQWDVLSSPGTDPQTPVPETG